MITSDQLEITLPDIKLGESHTFETLVSNSYPYTVHVGVKVGCGSCTIAGLYPNPIFEPNAVRTLRAKFTPTSAGAQVKTIRLQWVPQVNPGEKSELKEVTIRFKANVYT